MPPPDDQTAAYPAEDWPCRGRALPSSAYSSRLQDTSWGNCHNSYPVSARWLRGSGTQDAHRGRMTHFCAGSAASRHISGASAVGAVARRSAPRSPVTFRTGH